MDNPENTIIENDNEVSQHNPHPSEPAVTVPGIDLPAPETAKQPRNQQFKVPEPKNRQFTGRCTKTEYNIIQQVMKANNCTDIVRLMLFSINLHKQDLLTPFKLE